jgi:hypothetical protein
VERLVAGGIERGATLVAIGGGVVQPKLGHRAVCGRAGGPAKAFRVGGSGSVRGGG